MEKTLCIIKPDAVRKLYFGEIINLILDAGYRIAGLKMQKLSVERASEFYNIHVGKPFFESLLEYMTSGFVITIALEKINAVDDFRKFIGATDPQKAENGTIRKKFGTSLTQNAIHGSDSIENGKKETAFFFSDDELIVND